MTNTLLSIIIGGVLVVMGYSMCYVSHIYLPTRRIRNLQREELKNRRAAHFSQTRNMSQPIRNVIDKQDKIVNSRNTSIRRNGKKDI